MELAHLRTFAAVAAAGSFTAAAEGLFLTQPAISRQIQALEASLGATLLERGSRGVRLTDAGRLVRVYAQRCLGLVEDCRQELDELQRGMAGQVVVGVGGTHPMYELPGWLQRFGARYPGVEVSVRTGRSQEMVAAVCSRRLDLAFVRVPVTGPGLCVVGLYDEPIVLVAQPGRHPPGHELSPQELADAPLILFPAGTSFRAQLDAALAAAGVVPRVAVESDSVEGICSFAAVGLGMAFLPASTVRDHVAAGRLGLVRPGGLPPLTRRTSLIYLRDRYRGTAVREFIGLVAGTVA